MERRRGRGRKRQIEDGRLEADFRPVPYFIYTTFLDRHDPKGRSDCLRDISILLDVDPDGDLDIRSKKPDKVLGKVLLVIIDSRFIEIEGSFEC